jgi:hypothetical protein
MKISHSLSVKGNFSPQASSDSGRIQMNPPLFTSSHRGQPSFSAADTFQEDFEWPKPDEAAQASR